MPNNNNNSSSRGANSSTLSLPRRVVSTNCQPLLEMSSRCSGKVTDTIPQNFVKNQYVIAEAIIKNECAAGTGVLVFVSGELLCLW